MESTTVRPSDRFIPWYIVGFFVFFMVLLSWFAWIAFNTYPGETTKDAYKKGLAYNAAIAHVDEQNALGWKSDLQAVPEGNNLNISFALKDAGGHIITDAKVLARIVRPTQAGHDVEITLLSNGSGAYQADTKLAWQGVWEVHVSATRAGDNYQVAKTVVIQ